MMQYEVVPASIRHVRAMSRVMRMQGALALEGYGYHPREALRRALVASCHARTALVDGKPVAMWGVAGALLGEHADVWLVLSDQIATMPLAIVREAKAELAKAAKRFSEIAATVLPEDEPSIRFAMFLGFRGEAGGAPTDKDRLPIGDAYVFQLSYRG